ncbi:MAG: preprotein translocase subunit SecG [Clostridia bacterium]|jgi:preprotein translocase subunit SecG|nr:preprotein translocase subunit SecG [Clostridia bacterium]MCI9459357.1 preprotein translocase subunit SecG [Clostridia bacterium]MCX4314193.1 preprotein translocase subunit SecG [Clostridia bacterium]
MNLLSIAGWITDSFPIIRIVLISLMVAIGLALIVIILFQPSSSSGMGALSGQRDTFYSKDKSKSLESVMKKITIVLGIAEGVLAILFFVTLIIYRG